MTMKKRLTIPLVLATCVALLALPAAASAEYLIPDGNSAVNQYTEGIPTGGGEKSAKGAGEKEVKPAQTIGAANTKKLEEKGQEGRELAEVAAETAPPNVVIEDEPEASGDAGEGQKSGSKADGKKNAGKSKGDKDSKDDNSEGDGESFSTGYPVSSGDGPSGSGGFGEIVSAATGGSEGGLGLLLPLVIVGAIAWGVGYSWRKRDSDPNATAQP
jgi:hypothetical protein